mmetsp:Transcript_21009/g.59959  ORF Transcript_21009/g.59959 Transcript_21009/m.59959 type:complete len:305 (-) Transcript_21009:62-976(-)
MMTTTTTPRKKTRPRKMERNARPTMKPTRRRSPKSMPTTTEKTPRPSSTSAVCHGVPPKRKSSSSSPNAARAQRSLNCRSKTMVVLRGPPSLTLKLPIVRQLPWSSTVPISTVGGCPSSTPPPSPSWPRARRPPSRKAAEQSSWATCHGMWTRTPSVPPLPTAAKSPRSDSPWIENPVNSRATVTSSSSRPKLPTPPSRWPALRSWEEASAWTTPRIDTATAALVAAAEAASAEAEVVVVGEAVAADMEEAVEAVADLEEAVAAVEVVVEASDVTVEVQTQDEPRDLVASLRLLERRLLSTKCG